MLQGICPHDPANQALVQGGYYHELFLRSKRHFCRRIKRTRIKGKGPKTSEDQAPEVDFYSLQYLPEEVDKSSIDSKNPPPVHAVRLVPPSDALAISPRPETTVTSDPSAASHASFSVPSLPLLGHQLFGLPPQTPSLPVAGRSMPSLSTASAAAQQQSAPLASVLSALERESALSRSLNATLLSELWLRDQQAATASAAARSRSLMLQQLAGIPPSTESPITGPFTSLALESLTLPIGSMFPGLPPPSQDAQPPPSNQQTLQLTAAALLDAYLRRMEESGRNEEERKWDSI